MPTNEMTESDYDLADAIEGALSDTFESPSTIARKAKVATSDVHRVLPWMVRNNYLIAAGNGAWRKYRARKAGEYNPGTRAR
jgi:hypothetical protein